MYVSSVLVVEAKRGYVRKVEPITGIQHINVTESILKS